MSAYSKITSKNQTTVPAQVRGDLGLGPGDQIEYLRLADGQIVIRKAKHGLEALRGLIKSDRAYSDDEIVQMVRDARENMWTRDDWN